MIAKTLLPKDFQKLHDEIWSLTKYEANSRTRHWEYPWVMNQIQNYMKKNRINFNKKLSIIDIGATNSCLQFYYAKKGVDYACVNVSKDSFDKIIAKKIGVKVKYIIGRFEDIKVNKKYDLVLCVSVMEHTRKRSEKRILEKISKILKPKGRAIFTLDWFFDYKIGESCHWGHNPNCKNLIEMSEKLGLKLIAGNKYFLSGFDEFNEKDIKKDVFILKVCNKGVWLTSLAFVLEKSK